MNVIYLFYSCTPTGLLDIPSKNVCQFPSQSIASCVSPTNLLGVSFLTLGKTYRKTCKENVSFLTLVTSPSQLQVLES